ncbi:DEAD/DEAH box helicase [Parapedobacter koreensis]|uniref:DEAD-box ATP-dependent RNA helicase RhpA n=1 Tax=Parapedobacter koreensis TaxID=332977 RepID=A0A1H7S2B1_9SPHI|nr:DEAD/DEAH box helicase [Parapedobacter koreensis]SEL66615.1 ATP-dependent RNA helicase RhlE [Parapedobacter koreensis]
MSFSNLNLAESLLKALEASGYQQPTPIQQQAIPAILRKRDVLACAQTGTGKTAAFALPIIQHLLRSTPSAPSIGPRALIIAPTRELAIQIDENIAAYTRFTCIGHAAVFGGVSLSGQISELQKKPEMLVATPGRLLDLHAQRELSLQNVAFLVLDEADRMLDMGFIKDIKKIVSLIPTDRHTSLFSATMPIDITNLANTMLSNPEQIAVTPVASTVDKISQAIYPVAKTDKANLLIYLILKEDHAANILVFSRTKYGADRIARKLKKNGISAEAIHGDKKQQTRQNTLAAFKSGKIQALVATDIAARGLDIDRLQLVINYDLPNEPETYVHRIGRTGRAGESGRALSFCSPEEEEYLSQIIKLIKQQIPLVADHPFVAVNEESHQDQVNKPVPPKPKKKKKRKRPKAHTPA